MKGFLEYTETHKITPAFMEDFEHLVLKLYKNYKVKIWFEDFLGFCTEKLVTRIQYFDPARSNIGNYVYSLIVNEARRVNSKGKFQSEADVDTVMTFKADTGDVTHRLLWLVWGFAKRAYSLGVHVDQLALLEQYQAGVESPVCQAFCWLLGKGEIDEK